MSDLPQDCSIQLSIQRWLEICPQGYLWGTVYGHGPDERESELILADEVLREQAIRTTVQILIGERAALAASSGLINATGNEASKRFLATQTLDEARHVEIFTRRLFDLGVAESDLDATIDQYANPHLIGFAEILLEKVDRRDYVAGLVGQNIVLEGVELATFELMRQLFADINPKFAHTLDGAVIDERRHVGFGEFSIETLLARHPEKRFEIENMVARMSGSIVEAFTELFRDNPMLGKLQTLRRTALSRNGAAAQHGDRSRDLLLLGQDELEAFMEKSVVTNFRNRMAAIGIDYRGPRIS